MDTKTARTMRRFATLLRNDYPDARIILFGSKARGDDWGRSGYDLIVVSDGFRGVHWLDRISSILKRWHSTDAVDMLPYTPHEFAKKITDSSMISAAVKEGVEIAVT